jgi:hypothetical protein
MLCYRYFKEARNSLMHGGGLASDRAATAYLAFAPVSDRHSLGMKGNLLHEPLVEGYPVKLHLRGVVGFCDILNRLMITIDAELCRSAAAEAIAVQMIRRRWPNRKMLRADVAQRNAQVIHICNRAGLPRPANVDVVYDFPRQHQLIMM